jgi:hypothetical protein
MIRKILLKLATKIYKKYKFDEIGRGKLLIFNNDIFVVNSYEYYNKPNEIPTLEVTLYHREKLDNHIKNILK